MPLNLQEFTVTKETTEQVYYVTAPTTRVLNKRLQFPSLNALKATLHTHICVYSTRFGSKVA